ncbi:MAG TPA: flagellar assembly protein FliW [Clostridiales bacterium]|jgi:flagellar assembly factor FliW|nr:flagellar assembly protein FliW [Clostridiales bacterium]
MQIETKDFGTITIRPDDIILFPEGVYAFEDCRRFVVLDTKSKAGLMQLQSAEGKDPRFILLDPFAFVEDYNPILPQGALERLRASAIDELSFFVIAVIPQNVHTSTVNLKSPVVINFAEKLGAQVILENREYPVRFPLFSEEGAGSHARD